MVDLSSANFGYVDLRVEILDLSEIRVDLFPKKVTFSPQKIGPNDFKVEFSDPSDNKRTKIGTFLRKNSVCRFQSEISDLSISEWTFSKKSGPFPRKKNRKKI